MALSDACGPHCGIMRTGGTAMHEGHCDQCHAHPTGSLGRRMHEVASNPEHEKVVVRRKKSATGVHRRARLTE